MKTTIHESILKSIKNDIFEIIRLLEIIQRRSDFHEDSANRASRVADMAITKIESVLPENKEKQNERV